MRPDITEVPAIHNCQLSGPSAAQRELWDHYHSGSGQPGCRNNWDRAELASAKLQTQCRNRRGALDADAADEVPAKGASGKEFCDVMGDFLAGASDSGIVAITLPAV